MPPLAPALKGLSANALAAASAHPLRKAGSSALHRQLLQERIADLKSHIATGGLHEAVIRAMIYAGMPRHAIDERAFAMLRRIRAAQDDMPRMTLPQFKATVRQQFYLLLLEPEAAVEAIPNLLPRDAELRRKGIAVIRDVLSAAGELESEVAERLQQVARLFSVDTDYPGVTRLPTGKKAARAKAS